MNNIRNALATTVLGLVPAAAWMFPFPKNWAGTALFYSILLGPPVISGLLLWAFVRAPTIGYFSYVLGGSAISALAMVLLGAGDWVWAEAAAVLFLLGGGMSWAANTIYRKQTGGV